MELVTLSGAKEAGAPHGESRVKIRKEALFLGEPRLFQGKPGDGRIPLLAPWLLSLIADAY